MNPISFNPKFICASIALLVSVMLFQNCSDVKLLPIKKDELPILCEGADCITPPVSDNFEDYDIVVAGVEGSVYRGTDVYTNPGTSGEGNINAILTTEDVNNDGYEDFYILHSQPSGVSGARQNISLLSGRTLTKIYELQRPEERTFYSPNGKRFTLIPDQDNDGKKDLAVYTWFPHGISVYSGATGVEILAKRQVMDWVEGIEFMGDLSGDAYPDYMVTTSSSPCRLILKNFVSGAEIARFENMNPQGPGCNTSYNEISLVSLGKNPTDNQYYMMKVHSKNFSNPAQKFKLERVNINAPASILQTRDAVQYTAFHSQSRAMTVDVNGDGVKDLAQIAFNPDATTCCFIVVSDGVTLQERFFFTYQIMSALTTGTSYISDYTLIMGRDFNQDGKEDLVLVLFAYNSSGQRLTHQVVVISGADGSLLHKVDGEVGNYGSNPLFVTLIKKPNN